MFEPAGAKRGCSRRSRPSASMESPAGIDRRTTKCGTPVSTKRPRIDSFPIVTSTVSSNPCGSRISRETWAPFTSTRCTMREVSMVMRAGAIPFRYASRPAQRAPLPQKVGFPSGLKKEARRFATEDGSRRMTPSAPTESARVQRRRTRSGKSSRPSVAVRLSNRMKSLPAADILQNSIRGGVIILVLGGALRVGRRRAPPPTPRPNARFRWAASLRPPR